MRLKLQWKWALVLGFASAFSYAGSGLAVSSYSIVNAPSEVQSGDFFTVDLVLDLDGNASTGQEVSLSFTPGALVVDEALELGVPPYGLNISAGVRGVDDTNGVIDQFQAASFTPVTPGAPFVVGQVTFQAGGVGEATITNFFGAGAALLDGDGKAIEGVVFNGASVNVIPAATPTPTPTATPPAAMGICDDFNRAGPALGADWEVKSPDFEIQQDQLAEVSGLTNTTAQVLWTGAAGTPNQFGSFQVTTPGDNSQGFIFRSSAANGAVGPHYEVHVKGSDVRWEYVVDAAFVDRPDSCTLASPVQTGDWFGATIAGAGNGTVVEVFVSSAALDPNPNNWPAPVCTLTGNPATPVDAGERAGIRAFTSSQTLDTYLDDACLGGIPSLPTATPTATPLPTPTSTPTATPTPEPGLLLQLAAGFVGLSLIGRGRRRTQRRDPI